MNEIKLDNITFSRSNIDNALTIFKNTSINISGDGKVVIILGPSGTGKSTLLNILFGILKTNDGEVVVNGYNLNTSSEEELINFRRDIISLMFQNFPLINWLTCEENILCVNDNLNQNDLIEVLDEIDLLSIKDYLPPKLSVGQRQRIALLQNILNNRGINLLDEPTSALGEKYKFKVMNLLKKHLKNKLVIIATHDKELTKFADEIYEIKGQKLIQN